MSTEQKSADTLSGVVMGKNAAAAISGAAATGIDGGAVVSRVLQAQGVKYLFTVNGGHIWPILATLREHGVQLIHMRHEQTCAYAADAWARTTGTPGVCSVTAGCGLTNAVTGLCAAGLANSAVVCIAGQHPTTEDALGSFQEAYGSDVCRSFSKFTKRVLDWSTIEVDLRQAFREATNAPQGVTLVEIPTNILYQRGDPAVQRRGARVYGADDLRAGADPRAIERTIGILRESERPLIAAGDGVFWSSAADELREFAVLTGVPVYARRTGQARCRRITRSPCAAPGRRHSAAARTRCLRSGSASGAASASASRRRGARMRATSRPTPRRGGSACTCRPKWRSSAIRSSCCSS
jgi:acetolactate synthase-1/2/3 large subunit